MIAKGLSLRRLKRLRDHGKPGREGAGRAPGLDPESPKLAPMGVKFLLFLYYLVMTRVLLAEDDTSISEPLSSALRREGYEVDVTADGPSTLDKALGEGVDLILLDIGLPELDGLEVCRRVRAGGYAVPVLILTARADEVDTVVGLDAGADDYVTKPFRLAELLARVRALLRRGTVEGSAAHGVRIDPDARRAWRGDTELDLTTKEFDLLWILLRDAGKVVTREQIMREVWDASGGARPRRSTCTCPGCAASSATTRTARSSSPRCGASGSGSSAATDHASAASPGRRPGRGWKRCAGGCGSGASPWRWSPS